MNTDELPCVAFALRRESATFRKRFARGRIDAPVAAWACYGESGPFTVLETGVGATNARKALAWLITEYGRPASVVSAGFAGGLSSELGAGELFMPAVAVARDGTEWPCAEWPELGVSAGKLLTADQPVTDPAEKARLAAKFGAAAVDMESAPLARMCAAEGVPFVALRAISDDAATALSPQLASALDGGRVRPLALASAVTCDPRLTLELGRLARVTARAARALADALCRVFPPRGA